MIHLIYCYFIINAMFAGYILASPEGTVWMFLKAVYFGAFIIAFAILKALLEKLDAITEIRMLFLLAFTDRLRKWSEDKEMVESMREWYPLMTSYKQWVVRRWAKKYHVVL